MPTGEVLFSKGGKDGDSTADEWDDTELLKEYDRAVRPVKALVAERMGMTVEDITSATESCSSSKSARGDYAMSNHKKSKKHRKKKNKGHQQVEWSVGDHCQALYSLDGKMYEATIISLDHGSGLCCVQFVGYGNEEELSICSLKRSMGSAVRRSQRQLAKNDEAVAESTESLNHFPTFKDQVSQDSSRKFEHTSGKFKEPSSSFPHGHTPPPSFSGPFRMGPPPMPRIPSQGIFADMVTPPPPPHIFSNLPVEESEALSAMLMSWYMSGFHTGYFQGLKRAKGMTSSNSQ